ncbi:exo-alpha-sialidase [Micromonospora sp. C31]|uniref:sialidase family protein n=1 Tax=Micromonospora sp. C31 TaxID=2824876 RepID=UPI001B38D63C|nr:sialidase family protein [Micromonospora sp. C31]MBQ1072843.1 exo-alpha-sialidase [Micromonospora sp. C31]
MTAPSRHVSSRLLLALLSTLALILTAAVAGPAHAIPPCEVPIPPPACDEEEPYPDDRQPDGHFAPLKVWYGSFDVRGWAVDPDTSGAIAVEVHLDGTFQGRVTANLDSAQAAAAYPQHGRAHGFVLTVPLPWPGAHTVCVTAINHVPPGAAPAGDRSLGCQQVHTGTRQVSADPYTGTGAQHATQVEPDTFAAGDTVVAAFQVGRYANTSGAVDIGFAVSRDDGLTWRQGMLPGVATIGGGSYPRVTDPVVGFSQRHGTWLIATLGFAADRSGVMISRSGDGFAWQQPVHVPLPASVGGSGTDWDKEWLACDNGAWSSPRYGTCYLEVTDVRSGLIHVSTSTDGGATWTLARSTGAIGTAGQPVVRPDGSVTLVYSRSFTRIEAIRSVDGGGTWSAPVLVANTPDYENEEADLRRHPIPSVEVGGDGRVYAVWHTCAFSAGCLANGIAIATSADGATWSVPRRLPTGVEGDHFLPGIAVEPDGLTGETRIGLVYHSIPADCSYGMFGAPCEVWASYISSINDGQTWSAPTVLTHAMPVANIARSTQGHMLGDYVSASVVRGTVVSVVPVVPADGPAGAPYRQHMHGVGPLKVTGGSRPTTG